MLRRAQTERPVLDTTAHLRFRSASADVKTFDVKTWRFSLGSLGTLPRRRAWVAETFSPSSKGKDWGFDSGFQIENHPSHLLD